jgi:hypothetical protein
MLRSVLLAAAMVAVGCGHGAELDDVTLPGLDGFADRARIDARDVVRVDVPPTVDVNPFDATWFDGVAPRPDAAMDASDAADRCAMIAESYAYAIRQSQICTASTDCRDVVCETPCCTCQVYVNSTASSYRSLAPLMSDWTASGCASRVMCDTTRCDPPSGAECSTAGRCVTLRRGGG